MRPRVAATGIVGGLDGAAFLLAVPALARGFAGAAFAWLADDGGRIDFAPGLGARRAAIRVEAGFVAGFAAALARLATGFAAAETGFRALAAFDLDDAFDSARAMRASIPLRVRARAGCDPATEPAGAR